MRTAGNTLVLQMHHIVRICLSADVTCYKSRAPNTLSMI